MHSRSAETLLAAVLIAATLTGNAYAEADTRAADLAVARSALREGLVLFAVPVLERLQGDRTFPGRDEAVLLLARCRFRLRKFGDVARLLDGYEEVFPKSTRFFLPAAHDLARANLERARGAGARLGDRDSLLARARTGLQRVLGESTDQDLLASARFLLGVTLYEEEEYERALEVFSRATAMGVPPDRAQSLQLHIGHCHLMLRRFVEADRAYQAFISNFPRSGLLANGWYGAGEARYYLEQWQQAASAYAESRDAALRGDDREMAAQARYARGWALAKLGEKRRRARDGEGANDAWLAGLSEFEELLDTSPGVRQESATFESGELLYKLGRYEESAERLIALTDTRLHPTHAAAALYRLGDCRRHLGQMLEAADAYSKALEKAGATGELERRARFGYAHALVELGEPQRAREELLPLAVAAQSPSVRAAARREMGRVTSIAAKLADDRGDAAAAARLYARAYKDFDDLSRDEEALAELAPEEIAYWRGRWADNRARLDSDPAVQRRWHDLALAAYREVRKRSGRGKWTALSLESEAELRVFRGDAQAAADAYHELLSLDILKREWFRSDADAKEMERLRIESRLLLADLELERRNAKAARDVLAPVLADEKLERGHADASYKTAFSFLLEEGSAAVAESAFSAFLDRFPRSGRRADAIDGLATALWRQGKHAEAAEHYERLLASHPTYRDVDRVRLAAGDTARASGDAKRAAGHYRTLFEAGSSRELRALAGVKLGQLALAEGDASRALVLADRALGVSSTGRPASEAHVLRGTALVAAGRHEAAAKAFKRAVEDESRRLVASGPEASDADRAFVEFARFHFAGAVAAAGRSGRLTQPADTLRRAARAYVEVVQKTPRPFPEKSPVPSLKERAIFLGAEVLVELASAEQSDNRSEAALQELDEALQLLKLSADTARAAVRIREINHRRKALGRDAGR